MKINYILLLTSLLISNAFAMSIKPVKTVALRVKMNEEYSPLDCKLDTRKFSCVKIVLIEGSEFSKLLKQWDLSNQAKLVSSYELSRFITYPIGTPPLIESSAEVIFTNPENNDLQHAYIKLSAFRKKEIIPKNSVQLPGVKGLKVLFTMSAFYKNDSKTNEIRRTNFNYLAKKGMELEIPLQIIQ